MSSSVSRFSGPSAGKSCALNRRLLRMKLARLRNQILRFCQFAFHFCPPRFPKQEVFSVVNLPEPRLGRCVAISFRSPVGSSALWELGFAARHRVDTLDWQIPHEATHADNGVFTYQRIRAVKELHEIRKRLARMDES